jgi:hypothetical protein
MPARRIGSAPGSSIATRSGMRCTIFTQLTVASWAGSSENSEPEAGLIEAICAFHFFARMGIDFDRRGWPAPTWVRSVSLKFASIHNVFVATGGIAAGPVARKSPGGSVILPIPPSIGARTVACWRGWRQRTRLGHT